MTTMPELPPYGEQMEPRLQMPRETNKAVIDCLDYFGNHRGESRPGGNSLVTFSSIVDSLPEGLPPDPDERRQTINSWITETAVGLAKNDQRRIEEEAAYGTQIADAQARIRAEYSLKSLINLGVNDDSGARKELKKRAGHYVEHLKSHGPKGLWRPAKRREVLGDEKSLLSTLLGNWALRSY